MQKFNKFGIKEVKQRLFMCNKCVYDGTSNHNSIQIYTFTKRKSLRFAFYNEIHIIHNTTQ